VARLLPVARHTHTAEQNHRVTPAVSRHTNRHCSSGPWVPTKADEAAASGPSGSELASHWPDHPALPCDLGLVRNAAPNPWHLAIAQVSTPAASDPCAPLWAIGISAAVMVPWCHFHPLASVLVSAGQQTGPGRPGEATALAIG
jgi:hypothetical protein